MKSFWSRGFQPPEPHSNQATTQWSIQQQHERKGQRGGRRAEADKKLAKLSAFPPNSLRLSWLPSTKSFVPPNFTSQTAVRERNSVARVTCKAQEALERLRVSSTFNPSLWRIKMVAIPIIGYCKIPLQYRRN